MQPMAARLGVDHQRLLQFVTSSPWDVVPMRKTLARLAIGVIDPQAWVIDDTGQAKEGTQCRIRHWVPYDDRAVMPHSPP